VIKYKEKNTLHRGYFDRALFVFWIFFTTINMAKQKFSGFFLEKTGTFCFYFELLT